MLKTHAKFFAALPGAITGIVSFLADGEVSQNDIIGIAGIVAALVGLFVATNTPPT